MIDTLHSAAYRTGLRRNKFLFIKRMRCRVYRDAEIIRISADIHPTDLCRADGIEGELLMQPRSARQFVMISVCSILYAWAVYVKIEKESNAKRRVD